MSGRLLMAFWPSMIQNLCLLKWVLIDPQCARPSLRVISTTLCGKHLVKYPLFLSLFLFLTLAWEKKKTRAKVDALFAIRHRARNRGTKPDKNASSGVHFSLYSTEYKEKHKLGIGVLQWSTIGFQRNLRSRCWYRSFMLLCKAWKDGENACHWKF